MKRFFYIVSVLIVALLLVAGLLLGVLASSKVQTAAVGLVTDQLSRSLGATARIDKVEYRFPARIAIQGVYIEDQQKDTLLYIDAIQTRFHPLGLLHQRIRFSRLEASDIVLNAHQLADGQYNYQFFINAFRQEEKKSNSEFSQMLSVEDIRLHNIRIRYDDWHGVLSEARLALHDFEAHSIDAEISQMVGTLSNLSRSPQTFVLEDLQARLRINGDTISLPTLYARLPHSELDASGVEVALPHKDADGKRTGIAQLYASLHFNQADIRLRDLALLLPGNIGNIDKQIRLTGDIRGQLSDLSLSGLSLYYDNTRIIQGNVAISGLPDIKRLRLKAECEDLFCNAATAQDFVSDLREAPYLLPKNIHSLGDVHYKGAVEGQIQNLKLRGSFRTALGNISTNASLVADSTLQNMHLSGSVETQQFRIGRLVPNAQLGKISMRVKADVDIHAGSFPSGTAQAHIQNIDFRGHNYNDIHLNGRFAKNRYQGTLNIDDEYLQLQFTGLASMTQHDPEMDFDLTLNHFQPGKLHLIPEEKDIELSFDTHVSLSGIDPDRMRGYLVIDHLRLRNEDDSLRMQQLKVIADCDTTTNQRVASRSIQITSDYLNGKISGVFAYSTLKNSLLKQAVRYCPSLFSPEETQRIQALKADNTLQFYLYAHDLQTIERVMQMPIRTQDSPVLRGKLNDSQNKWEVNGYLPRLWFSSHQQIQEITLALSNSDVAGLRLSFCMPPDTMILVPHHGAQAPQSLHIPGIHSTLFASLHPDSIDVLFTLRPDDENEKLGSTNITHGDLRMGAKIQRYNGLPFVSAHIRPSTFLQNGNPYSITESHISYNVSEKQLSIRNFRIGSEKQYVAIDGVASPSANDSLTIQLGEINPRPLLPFVLSDKILSVEGKLTGWAKAYSVFSTPMFCADVSLKDAGLNGSRIGDAKARVELDRKNMTILIDGDVDDNGHRVAHVDGLVTPKEHAWQLDIATDSFDLGFINHWTSGFLSDIGGTASGKVRVMGRMANTWVLAQVKANDGRLTIPFTGCTYTFSDSVFMDSTSIRFPNVHAHDVEGNPLLINGDLKHNNFAHWMLNLRVDVDHALAFDIPETPGEFMSGHVYAKGYALLHGPDNDIHLDANAMSVGKSKFRLSIDGFSSASENNFIHFVQTQEDESELPNEILKDQFWQPKEKKEYKLPSSSKFVLNMNVDATQEALFQLVLDERTGDILQARGDGAIRITYDTSTEDVLMMGTYTAQSGSLGFTIGNVIRRDFSIAPGSQIIWSGDAENPALNVTAKYHVVANLRDLFGNEVESMGITRTSVPVNTLIMLTSTLEHPLIRFALELPMSEDAIQNQVRNVINTDEMLMRQVIYLLVFGRFYTPEYMQNTAATGVNEVYSILSSTITGQINSWLGKLTDVFTMGVNIRTEGEGAGASQEYEAQFQLQPVDRLVINGNLGYRYNDISNRPFFGDVDIEYMLTPNGKVRAKAYTHTVDKYSLRQANTIQGVGFVFRHDFNWPWHKRQDKKAREEQKKKSKNGNEDQDENQSQDESEKQDN